MIYLYNYVDYFFEDNVGFYLEDKESLMNETGKPCSFIGLNVYLTGTSYENKVLYNHQVRSATLPGQISGKFSWLHKGIKCNHCTGLVL